MITADVMGYPAQWNRLQWIDLSTFSDERGITLNDFNELSIKPFNSNRESVLQEDYVLVLGGGEADKCIAWTTPYTALRYAIDASAGDGGPGPSVLIGVFEMNSCSSPQKSPMNTTRFDSHHKGGKQRYANRNQESYERNRPRGRRADVCRCWNTLTIRLPPERTAGHAVVMRGGIPPRAAIPLHNHESPEIFYILEGTMEVFQDDGESSGWQTAGVGDVVTIAGGVKHALRNPGDTTVMTVLVAEEQLFRFLRELAEPLATGDVPPVPTPEVMRRLFEVAARYRYWIGSPEENAAIGLLLG